MIAWELGGVYNTNAFDFIVITMPSQHKFQLVFFFHNFAQQF